MKQNIWVSETGDRQEFKKHDLGKRQTRQSGMKEKNASKVCFTENRNPTKVRIDVCRI